jgi:acetylornithine deacetylase
MDVKYAQELLRELVAIPSVNPGFTHAPADTIGEEQIGAFLQCWARDNGIFAQRFEAAKVRPCILLETGPKEGPALLVSAHMDTVWTEMNAPFTLQERDNDLYGLGAVDDKGPLVSALCALRELNRINISLRFLVLATCDEEFGLLGIRHMIPDHIRPDGVIIAEPTNLKIVTAHKGCNRFAIQTKGQRVHSSLVPAGENAIYKAAELVSALKTYSAALLRDPPHPLLGTNTLNVGVIQGGTQPNVVPDACTLTLDFRSLPGETPESIRAHVTKALANCEADYDIIEEAYEAPALDTSPDIPMVKHLQKILSADGLDAEPHGVPFTTESFRPAECGIPTIVFGPGDIAAAHAIDEKIAKDQLLQAAELLFRLAASRNWQRSDFMTSPN